MTNPIDTIKRVREIMQMDCQNMASFLAAESARTFHYSEAAKAIEHLLGIIKQMHEALDIANRSLHMAPVLISRNKVCDGGAEELLHYANQVESHVFKAWCPVGQALELSAPYAELEDL